MRSSSSQSGLGQVGNFAWLIAPVLTVLACLAADRIGAGLGLLDHPDGGRKRHERSTPLIGGLVVVVPWSIMLIVRNRPLRAAL